MRRGDGVPRETPALLFLLSSTIQLSRGQPLPSPITNGQFAACSLFQFPKHERAWMVDEHFFF